MYLYYLSIYLYISSYLAIYLSMCTNKYICFCCVVLCYFTFFVFIGEFICSQIEIVYMHSELQSLVFFLNHFCRISYYVSRSSIIGCLSFQCLSGRENARVRERECVREAGSLRTEANCIMVIAGNFKIGIRRVPHCGFHRFVRVRECGYAGTRVYVCVFLIWYQCLWLHTPCTILWPQHEDPSAMGAVSGSERERARERMIQNDKIFNFQSKVMLIVYHMKP